MVEKVQRSFTRFISGMAGLSYTERLAVLKLYSLQRGRERYIVIYVWKILEGLVPNLYPPICSKTPDRRGRTCISSHINVGRLGTLEYNSFRWCAIRLFNQLFNLYLYVIPLYVLFIVSRNNWIATYLQCLILRVCQDSITAWIMEIVLDGGHPVMAWLGTRCSQTTQSKPK